MVKIIIGGIMVATFFSGLILSLFEIDTPLTRVYSPNWINIVGGFVALIWTVGGICLVVYGIKSWDGKKNKLH